MPVTPVINTFKSTSYRFQEQAIPTVADRLAAQSLEEMPRPKGLFDQAVFNDTLCPRDSRTGITFVPSNSMLRMTFSCGKSPNCM